MQVRARAPLRLGLAGGGSDVEPYTSKYGGAVLNATINKFVFASVVENESDSVRFNATCQGESCEYALAPYIDHDGKLDLFKAVYNAVVNRYNHGKPMAISLSTFTDAPPGSGLGSSSSLVVAMLGAMLEYLNISILDYDLAQLAFDVERVDVGLKGGKQDQYAATFGGFNFIEFHQNGQVLVNPLRIKPWVISELEASLVLYFTGVSRASAEIIEQQVHSLATYQDRALASMHEVKAHAYVMKEHLLRGNITDMAEALNAGWRSKKQTSSSISNPEIEQVFEQAFSAGAIGGKVSGAGGGGFIMFIVDPLRRSTVEATLSQFSGTILNCSFSQSGIETWRIP